MTSKRKKIGLTFIILFVIALVGLFLAKHLVSSKFEEVVKNLPQHIDLQYDNADFDIISGNLTLERPLLTINSKTAKAKNVQIALKSFEIKDLSYWEFYNNNAINLEAIRLSEPKVTYYYDKNVKGESSDSTLKEDIKKTISIGMLNIDNATINIVNVENDSLLFSSEKLYLKLSSISSKFSQASKLPFIYKDISLVSENIKYQINDFDDLFIKSIDINNNNSKFSEVQLKTKYSKTELSKYLKAEREYVDLTIASVEIKDYNLTTKEDSKISFKAQTVNINSLILDLYRDKFVADNTEHKLLYSKMLRDLKFDLDLREVIITDGLINYQEKSKIDNQAGQLVFSQLEASVTNVSNINTGGEQTKISITSNFMKDAPLKVDWNFDVNDVNDQFVFKADLGLLKADELNQFMQPNLNLKLEGELIKTYFTVGGNANTSVVDLKTKYNQFDVIMLKEDGKEKNKLISGLVNLFISKNSNDESNNFRQSDTKVVERDKTKSVFNFVWKNVQAGLLSAMVGDGEKDN